MARLRASLAMRVSPLKLLHQFGCTKNVPSLASQLAGVLGREAFERYIRQVKADYAELLQGGLVQLNSIFVEKGVVTPAFEIDMLDATLNPRIRGIEAPKIIFPVGFILAIEDAVLAACADGRFLMDFGEEEPLEITSLGWSLGERAEVSYYNFIHSRELDFSKLGVAIPVEDGRLMEAQCLIDSAILFTLFHEVAHYLAGHTAMYASLGMGKDDDYAEVPPEIAIEILDKKAIRQCFELQADAEGLDCVLSEIGLSENDEFWVRQYQTELERLASPYVERPLEMAALRVLSTGAAIAMFVNAKAYNLELSKSPISREARDEQAYPLASARSFSLMQNIFVHANWDFVEFDEAGTPFLQKSAAGSEIFLANLKSILMPMLYDLQFLCYVIDVPNLFFEAPDAPIPGVINSFEDSAILTDLLSDLSGEETFRTNAARQFFKLRPLSDEVRRACDEILRGRVKISP